MVGVKSIESKRKDYSKAVKGETSSSTSSMCDVKSLVSKADSYTEFVMDSSGTAVTNVKRVSKGGKYKEIANREMGSSGSTSLDAKIVSKGENHRNIANDLGHSGSIGRIDVNGEESRKRKRKKRKGKKLAVSVILEPNDDLQDSELANSGRQDVYSSKQSHGFSEQMETNIASSLAEKLIIGNREILNDQNLVPTTKGFANHHRMQPPRTHVTTSRKMLLILDVNGLLADIVHPAPKDFTSDIKISRRAIFKRPFLDDFLVFCFERFDVAIWSSRTRKILDPVVDYLLGDLKKKLVFLWDISHCTESRARSLENHYKFIVFKKLWKVWEENGPTVCENGYYDESNTLLLDDSPYKALLNPKHTGIFPFSYSYKDINDNSLGPDGDLRVYLEGLAATENVKMHVELHPFGQPAIDETSADWAFYTEVLEGVS